MKKPSRKSLTRDLDRLSSKLVRMRGKCQKCGLEKYEKLQCCHVYSRKYRSVRWYRDNLLCLCSGCHFWGHHNPIDFTEFVKEVLGEYRYELLKNTKNVIKQWKIPELISLRETLQRAVDGV